MPHFLLKINKRKWDKLDVPWLEPNQIQADPLGDLKISEGTLSVWHVNDDKSNLDIVITALAANRDNFDKFEYGLFDQTIAMSLNLKMQNTPGTTPIDKANIWHRDVVELTAEKAFELIKAIFDTFEKQRVLDDDIKTKILNADSQGNLDIHKVHDPMKSRIIKSR